jgi:hypothetical protein
VQLRSEGKSLLSYFGDFWNLNDFFCMPIYFCALVTTWSWVRLQEDELRPRHLVAVKTFYLIVIYQAFIKLLFLLRIFDSVCFMILLIPKIFRDLKPFFVFTVLANILFSTMYLVLEVQVGNEYTLVFPPLKWFIYTLRNGLHDFYIDE